MKVQAVAKSIQESRITLPAADKETVDKIVSANVSAASSESGAAIKVTTEGRVSGLK